MLKILQRGCYQIGGWNEVSGAGSVSESGAENWLFCALFWGGQRVLRNTPDSGKSGYILADFAQNKFRMLLNINDEVF
jgi:hypothetical protein